MTPLSFERKKSHLKRKEKLGRDMLASYGEMWKDEQIDKQKQIN
jgi:hypothetical protein